MDLDHPVSRGFTHGGLLLEVKLCVVLCAVCCMSLCGCCVLCAVCCVLSVMCWLWCTPASSGVGAPASSKVGALPQALEAAHLPIQS